MSNPKQIRSGKRAAAPPNPPERRQAPRMQEFNPGLVLNVARDRSFAVLLDGRDKLCRGEILPCKIKKFYSDLRDAKQGKPFFVLVVIDSTGYEFAISGTGDGDTDNGQRMLKFIADLIDKELKNQIPAVVGQVLEWVDPACSTKNLAEGPKTFANFNRYSTLKLRSCQAGFPDAGIDVLDAYDIAQLEENENVSAVIVQIIASRHAGPGMQQLQVALDESTTAVVSVQITSIVQQKTFASSTVGDVFLLQDAMTSTPFQKEGTDEEIVHLKMTAMSCAQRMKTDEIDGIVLNGRVATPTQPGYKIAFSFKEKILADAAEPATKLRTNRRAGFAPIKKQSSSPPAAKPADANSPAGLAAMPDSVHAPFALDDAFAKPGALPVTALVRSGAKIADKEFKRNMQKARRASVQSAAAHAADATVHSGPAPNCKTCDNALIVATSRFCNHCGEPVNVCETCGMAMKHGESCDKPGCKDDPFDSEMHDAQSVRIDDDEPQAFACAYCFLTDNSSSELPWLEATATHCGTCGAPASSKLCTKCTTVLDTGAKFCHGCRASGDDIISLRLDPLGDQAHHLLRVADAEYTILGS